MNDERKKKLWLRFKSLHEKRRYHCTNRLNVLQSSPVQPTDLDDDVKMLHSYFVNRRHNRCGPTDDYYDKNYENPMDTISQEVNEWKKIQNDVRMQLTVLSKAVQKLHQTNSQSRIPNLEKVKQ